MSEVYSKDIQELAGECAVQELFTQVRWRFRQLEENGGFTKAELGRRMGVPRSQIRTAAKMLMAMGVQLKLTVSLPPPIS
jgi:predicted transcriptional regulator